MTAANEKKVLSDVFGEYRNEWRQDEFGRLFVRPPYFTDLESVRPCFLVGGRGSGKTTALKSLRYDVTRDRINAGGQEGQDLPYLGIYLKLNKSRVRAFQGAALSPDDWSRVFAHYFNLLICEELGRMYAWLVRYYGWPQPPTELVQRAASSLGASTATSIEDLNRKISDLLPALEVYINNPGRVARPILSQPETPVKLVTELFEASGMLGKRLIMCCIDEYENLLDSQQAVINTYFKNTERPLTYKVGVRRYGLRNRQTIDGYDQLVTPDDYDEIDISERAFDNFAMDVYSRRLELAREMGVRVPVDTADFLPGLRRRDEAVLLGADRISDDIIKDIQKTGDATLQSWAEGQHKGDLYLLKYWSEASGSSVPDLARDWVAHPKVWANRINNYGYESLFWITKGRKGTQTRKYYCGVDTFLDLASGNIRYFLELIHESIKLEFETDMSEMTERKYISVAPIHQTRSAQEVGRRRLDQLEGLSSEHGYELKRFVLTIGKVFFEFARMPQKHAPELVFFVLSGSADAKERVTALLKEGVSHLAFSVTPRTKATSGLEIKDNEYRLHPIFSPFFEFSHRRKRRVVFDADVLLLMKGDKPSIVISKLLEGRVETDPDDLPEQLAMFSAFYDGGAGRA